MQSSTTNRIKDYLFSNCNFERRYQTVLWWEIYRIFYNGLMLIIGIVSIAVAAINIPILYILMAFALNLVYCLLWIIELSDKKELIKKNKIKSFRIKSFVIYLIVSIICVSIIPILILIAAY